MRADWIVIMPELPEVETTVAGLRQVLDGQQIVRAETRRDNLRWPFPADLRQRLTGAKIIGLSRRAKYGLVHTDRNDIMIFHLGMSGRWRIDPETIEKHDHFILEMGNGRIAALNDPRRFGSVDIVQSDQVDAYKAFITMGPEPLSDDFTAQSLKSKLDGKSSIIKTALLDQRVVAGLGNIYVCEALYMSGILPSSKAGSISKARLEKLVSSIKTVLASAIEAGGSTLRDFAAPDGELGYFSNQWLVYGRENESCSKGHVIKRCVDGGRSTFYCPKCQR